MKNIKHTHTICIYIYIYIYIYIVFIMCKQCNYYMYAYSFIYILQTHIYIYIYIYMFVLKLQKNLKKHSKFIFTVKFNQPAQVIKNFSIRITATRHRRKIFKVVTILLLHSVTDL